MTMSITRIRPLYDQKDRLIGYLDIFTGEKYGFPVITSKKENPYSRGWIMNSQEAAILVAKDRDIKGETHRVLWFLIGILDFENWIQLSATEMGKELNMHRQDISKAIKVLERKEIILRGSKIGRSYSFMLNPEFGWKGKVKNLEKYREDKYKNRKYTEQISKKGSKSLEKTKISEFSEEVKYLSREYDIPLEKVQSLLKAGILKLDKKD